MPACGRVTYVCESVGELVSGRGECWRQESLLIRCGIPTRKKNAKSVTQIRDKIPTVCLEIEWRVVVGANVGSAKS